MPASPGQTLSHYRLLSKIGEGGMGVVWKAEDSILGRTVAIKVLPADLARDEKRRKMFFDEARLASSLSEAHIAQVYEFGREGDLEFIVMEFVEGKPLSKVLQGRPLPTDRVVDIGLQAARALSRAHRKKLLHRDLKPSNIMVTPEGDVKVVDFGLARLFSSPEPEIGTEDSTRTLEKGLSTVPSTSTGRGPAGTLPYMSPEQIRGERLDSRSDIFSLGVVLYESTVGQRPFTGSTPDGLILEILGARLTPLHDLVPKVPLELERIIHKTLAKKPSERYQTMDDLAVDLKRLSQDLESGSSPSYDELVKKSAVWKPRRLAIIAAFGILALGSLGLIVWEGKAWIRIFPRPGENTVLILPLEILGQEEGGGYLGRAFAEAIAINLAQARKLQILPVPSEAEFKDAGPQARVRAAADMGAGRLLSGSLQRNGSFVHVSLSLVDTAANRILWGAQGDIEDAAMTSLASSLARQAASELGSAVIHRYDYPRNLTGSPEMAGTPYFVQAIEAVRRNDYSVALKATQQLAEQYPKDVDARSLRVYAVFQATVAGLLERAELEKEIQELERFDPGNATAQNIRCELLLNFDRRLEDAVQCSMEMLQRTDLTPAGRAWALRDRAGAKSAKGDHIGGLEDIKEALLLDPTNQIAYTMRGDILKKMGNLRGAEAAYRQLLALAPESYYARWNLADVLYQQARIQESLPLAAEACKGSHNQAYCAVYATRLLKAGKRNEAIIAARQADTLTDFPENGDFELASFWALAGETDEALQSYKNFIAATKPEPADLIEWSKDPNLDSLRSNSEFKSILAEAARRSAAEAPKKIP